MEGCFPLTYIDAQQAGCNLGMRGKRSLATVDGLVSFIRYKYVGLLIAWRSDEQETF